MHRRTGSGRQWGRKKGDSRDRSGNRENESFHRRNIRIAASPLLLIFSIIRIVAFQLWVVVALLICKSRAVLPAKKRNSDAESGMSSPRHHTHVGPGEPALVRQKQHHRKAFEYISKALKIDEEEAGTVYKGHAMEYYKKGISELERGIAINTTGKGDAFERARRLKDKMATNLVMAQDRLEVLEKVVATVSFEPKGNGLPSFSSTPSSNQKPKNCDAFRRHMTSSGVPKAKSQVKPPTSNTTATSRPLKPVRQPMSVHKSNTLPRPSRTQSNSPTVSRKPISRLNSCDRNPTSHTDKNKPKRDLKDLNLKNVDKKLAATILNEVVDQGPPVRFKDIAGQDIAKQALQEIVILPALRPELFTGLRAPARGLLLFGPPGNGKTMLAKAVANESNATFFSISASSLTSKWVGEGEKLVRALFTIARELQPSVVFLDEIDSLLCERREGENDASRRLKTEFLVQFDGVGGNADDRILIMGATNRPQELDDAVLRRFTKRVYVSMPGKETRKIMLENCVIQT
ncbi:hypothetical protein ScPMuIL_014958 [Solemya velum]